MSWPGQVSGVVARAVNLSPMGILVDAPTWKPRPVGSPIVCDVPLPRGCLRLRGRVAHRRVLSPAHVEMGIAFAELSPRMVAQLRDVIDESEEKAQVVNLRFPGKNQLHCTRALPTAEGFQFTTALPFLRSETEVEIAHSPNANLATKGWVSSVALDRAGGDGVPRLVIDIRAAENAAPRLALAAISGQSQSSQSSQAPAPPPEVRVVPERASDPWEVRPTHIGHIGHIGHLGHADCGLPAPESEPRTDPPEGAANGVIATAGYDVGNTEVVRIVRLPPRASGPRAAARPRTRTLAFSAGSIAVAAVAAALFGWVGLSRSAAPPPVEAPVVAPPAPIVEPIVEPILESIVKPGAGTTANDARAALAEPAGASSEFAVGLAGSLKGANSYPLQAPDGIAFNFPNAHATRKVGTYRPAVPGLRAVSVRDLPGGGTHLRFYYTASGPAPEVRLDADGVRVVGR